MHLGADSMNQEFWLPSPSIQDDGGACALGSFSAAPPPDLGPHTNLILCSGDSSSDLVASAFTATYRYDDGLEAWQLHANISAHLQKCCHQQLSKQKISGFAQL